MELETRDVANVRVIHIAGRIDHTNAEQFQAHLLPQLLGCTGETQKALLDLHRVAYMSSAGLRVLMLASKQCQKQRGTMVLAALPTFLQEVFRISRFDMVFQVFTTVADGLAQLSPPAAVAYSGAA